ncbi:hypothetical protein OK351_17540 [Glutamicibacter sp. MNS18]|uniref:hypothetical protein n=1 Tax=Glutamicibacter sp. MNS18 TaxID=2989817 RepID=UPI0022368BFA|nr:hypothetical protein [Glutamicibacter sp. MNS18]MCW4467287.1 hypothetical protein [Glutamicibacter sp. MNS18]
MGRLVRCRFQAGERRLGGHDVVKWMIQFCGDLPVFGNAEEMIEGFVENPSDLIRGGMVIALSVRDLIQCRREQLAASRNLALDVRQAVFDAVLLLRQLE